MAEPSARLYLVTPLLTDASLAPRLAEACAGGQVAAVLLRLGSADERSLINQVKALVPSVQEAEAAAVIAVEGEADLAAIAARGGADGIHLSGSSGRIKELRDRLKTERAIGVGGLRTKDDAMTMGEAGVDYLMFGEPRPDGSLPSLDTVVERASWWAEIFETPCVVFAPTMEAVTTLAGTGAEFIALGDVVWSHPEGPGKAVAEAATLITAQEALS
ncbi:thiamine phosphate synthase [Microvirga rosea]|uniref:thiamine phosphate synthase n=1 Tax=Microvirga rosea TaxID=2715425 RepID=UPI001D0AA3E8|nr:thiamine phosphate synthase [Microvirga rosea]MCB8822362.1 thiamine phosphate synthase [Microvirga rosea]